MKIQSFYIFRFNSGRIIRHNYNIELTVNESRCNNEIVSIAENQTIRSLFQLRGRSYDPNEIYELFKEKRKLKNKSPNLENTRNVSDIENRIDEILFVPEICSVIIQDKKHYSKLINNGFYVNGKKMVRCMCGAGHSRRNTVIFCSEEIEKPLKKILNNGRNENVEVSENKFNAYFALAFSGTQTVSEPYMTIIPDYEIKRLEKVDYVIEENDDFKIEEKEIEMEFNCFDGMGLISIEKAKEWSEELGLDYVPSTFIIRNAFLKGMVAVFDIHRYSDEVGIHMTKDIYGLPTNTRDMDLILSKSMFKGNIFYNSVAEYTQKCRENGMKWGISRYGPKKDFDYVFSNYQFLQNFDLNDEKIEKLCQKTIDYFEKSIGKDISYSLLYLMGDICRKDFDPDIFSKISDTVTKALILNNDLIKDPYIQNHISHSFNKKIKEAYIGNLLFDGNYSTMISDPVAFMEHCFGLSVKGLLDRNEHYSNYWIKKGIKEVVSMRSPLTWRSEAVKLNLKNNKDTNFWYQHIHSGIIFNIHGTDMALEGGADVDGDLTMTTNNVILLDSIYGGLPIEYSKGKAPKKKIVEEELWKADEKSFDTPIGLITNASTTMNVMIEKFDKNSEEYNELIQRLKLCRFFQGQAIDAAKNLNCKKMPKYWFKWTKITDKMTDEEKHRAELNNKLIIDKRPYFMRHLYSHLNRKYIKHNAKYDNHSTTTFRKTLANILKEYHENKECLNQEELEFISKYFRFSPIIEEKSIVNKICLFLEKRIKEIKQEYKTNITEKDIISLQDYSIPFDENKYKLIYDLYKQYKAGKRNFAAMTDTSGEEMFKTIDQYNKSIKLQAFLISDNIRELANLAVNICYIAHPSDNKQFCWQVFGDGILENIYVNRQKKCFLPFEDKYGDIEYMGDYFKMFEINVENNQEELEYESYI